MLQDLFITTAHAQSGPDGAGPALANILFMVLFFVILYFMLIRPQQKQAKTHKEMVENLQRGDTVITAGGMVGRVHRLEDDLAVLDVGEVEVAAKTFRTVRVKVKKVTITQVTAKAGGSATDDDADKK